MRFVTRRVYEVGAGISPSLIFGRLARLPCRQYEGTLRLRLGEKEAETGGEGSVS